MAEPIESWSSNDHIQYVISESGKLMINEQLDAKRIRSTTLSPGEALDLLQFLWRSEQDIFDRMPEPKSHEATKWHQWRKEVGFE